MKEKKSVWDLGMDDLVEDEDESEEDSESEEEEEDERPRKRGTLSKITLQSFSFR